MPKISMPKSRRGRLTTSVVGGLLGLCLMFACFSSILSPQGSKFEPIEDRIPTPIEIDTPTSIAQADTPTPHPPTDTPAPIETPTMQVAPTEVPTVIPVLVDTVVPSGAISTTSANLRSGPGTSFAVTGNAQPGEQLEIVGRTPAGDWFLLATGMWIASQLVKNPPTVPVVLDIPTPPTALLETVNPPTALAEPPPPAGSATIADVKLVKVVNDGMLEIIEIRNLGARPIEIGGWKLIGSVGNDFCIIPVGTVLQAGTGFQVATGNSQPTGVGYKCGDKPIWANDGETIFLQTTDGQEIQIRVH